MFDVPDDTHYLDSHEWARRDDDTVRVGISDFAQDELGDVVFVELPAEGDDLTAGEAFGEQGIYADHAMAHRACQRVPLVVDWPDGPEGRAVEEFVHQFDLMPTLCELADVPVPSGWDAESFAPLLRGDSIEGRDYLVTGHGNYVYSRAVYTDRFAYTRILHPGVFSLPGEYNDPDLPGGGLELLHDRETDSFRTENLVAGQRPVSDALGWDGARSRGTGDRPPARRSWMRVGSIYFYS